MYQESPTTELSARGISFQKKRFGLEYQSRTLRPDNEPDFLCFGEIIVEIKALKHVTEEHRAQLIKYGKATGK